MKRIDADRGEIEMHLRVIAGLETYETHRRVIGDPVMPGREAEDLAGSIASLNVQAHRRQVERDAKETSCEELAELLSYILE